LVPEAVGFLLPEGDGAGDRLARRAGQARGREPGLLPSGQGAQVVAAPRQGLEFLDFRGRRRPGCGPLAVGVLGDESGVGAVGLVPRPAPQAGVLNASGVNDRDGPAGVGAGGGEGEAVGAGALPAESGRGPAGVLVGPGGQGGVAGVVVGEGVGVCLAAGRWQQAGVEGRLADVDADPGGRGGGLVTGQGVVCSTAWCGVARCERAPPEGVRGRGRRRPARDRVPEVRKPSGAARRSARPPGHYRPGRIT
jgi:hypothetical protein